MQGDTATLLQEFIENITERREQSNEYVATDQLLNAVYLIKNSVDLKTPLGEKDSKVLRDFILRTIAEIENR